MAYVFTRALGDHLGTGRAYRGPLNSEENLQRRAFDRCSSIHTDRRHTNRRYSEADIQQVDKEDRASYAVCVNITRNSKASDALAEKTNERSRAKSNSL